MTRHGGRRARTHIKDPFYRQILDALEAIAPDSEVFEACMGDILRPDLPGLVPVPGGKDQGRDGEFPDRQGRPSPLIVTTQENVARNLRTNLDTILRGGSTAGEVALATSRALTWAQRRRLSEVAAEKGFTLRPVFEQRAVAARLYRNSRWCRELLGLSGASSALSVVPPTRRPLFDMEPIGRQGDIDWLQSSSGDLVLSGAPGSGKTFLLYHLICSQWNALFLVSDDEQAIKNAVREQEPGIVVVDDAHGDPALLTRLVRLRREIGADFAILATSWEGGRKEVQVRLQVPDTACRKLELLARNQIVEVFHGIGVSANDEVMRELVDQAANKPGLAATIGRLWLQGSWQKVLDGSAVMAHLVSTFGKLVGREAEEVLASFALGGDQGMPMQAVAIHLRLDLPRVRQVTIGLAAGGVLSEIVDDDQKALAVHPRRLRSALLKSVFFSGRAIQLDFRDLLPQALKMSSAVEALAVAKLCGAKVPDNELRKLVLSKGTASAWEALSCSGEDDARWVLANYRGDTFRVLSAALEAAPREAVEKMLERAADRSLSDRRRGEVLNLFASWAKDRRADPVEAIQRRRCLARTAKRYLLAGGDRSVGVQALMIAISPEQKDSSIDPGRGDSYTMRWALLPRTHLLLIPLIWEEIRDSITEIDQETWNYLSGALWNWIYPQCAARGDVDPERRDAMHAFAGQVLKDLVPLALGSPGLAAGLRGLASRLGIELLLEHDPIFELLYLIGPTEPSPRAVVAVAQEWVNRTPEAVAAQFEFYQAEATRIGRQWTPTAPELFQLLAGSVDSPEAWLHAFQRRRLPPVLLGPFLRATVTAERPGWKDELERCLESNDLAWEATSIVLQLPDPPEALLAHALEKVRLHTQLPVTMALRKQLPLPTLRLLLCHPDWQVALAAAVGDWSGSPQGTVRAEIRADWRSAVVRASVVGRGDETDCLRDRDTLGLILASDVALALDWVQARLSEPQPWTDFSSDSPAAQALAVLSCDQRRAILDQLGGLEPSENRSMLHYLIPRLINRDLALYSQLLEKHTLGEFHDAPLAGVPDETWAAMAIMALDAGLDPARVASASIWSGGLLSPVGDEGRRWAEGFAQLAEHPRQDVQQVGRHGQQLLQEGIELVQRSKKRLDMYGLG